MMTIFAASVTNAAQVTYDYTGQTMTLTGVTFYAGPGDCCQQTFTTPYSVLGDVVLSQALNPNQANQQVVPIAYAFNDPGLEPTSGGGFLQYNASQPYGSPLEPVGPNPVPWPGNTTGIGVPTLTFSTSNGNITAFSMTFGGSYPYGYETLTLSSAGDSFSSNVATPDCECGGYWNGSNMVGGSWAQAPEINPSIAVTALTLLAGGLLVVMGRRPASP
jgi:hypothetical protein